MTSALGLLMISGSFLLALPGTMAADPTDLSTYLFPWVQPDGPADGGPNPAFTWGDAKQLSATTLTTGDVLFKLDLGDMAAATGGVMYVLQYQVEGTAYQTGAQVYFAAGTVACSGPGSWSGDGAYKGRFTIEIPQDRILFYVDAAGISELQPGVQITNIVLLIGAIAGAPCVAGAGFPELHDVVEPSVEPIDFTVGATGSEPGAGTAVPELFSLASDEPSATAEAGGEATYALSFANDGEADADYELSTAGLPEDFSAEFDAPSGTIPAGGAVDVTLTVSVPSDASQESYPFSVLAMGPHGGNASVSLDLEVSGAGSEPSPSPSPEPSGSEEPSPSENASATSESGEPAGSDEPKDDKAGIPGFEAVLLGLAGVAAVVLIRRRK